MKYQIKIPDLMWYRTNVMCMEACPVHTDSGKYVQFIGKGIEVGPDLLGVSEKREAPWLKKMIRTPKEMEKTDPIAKKLFLEYKELGMPTAGLSEEEAEAILKYIESFKKNSGTW